METRVIILTRGIQGSGKSTWAKKWVTEDPLNRIRFNNDDMRNMMGIYWPEDSHALKKRENALQKIKEFSLNTYMVAGYDIVVDNMNLSNKETSYFDTLVENYNKNNTEFQYHIEYKDFFIPVEECIRRDAMRERPVGAALIKKIWRIYRDKIIHIETEKMLKNQVTFNPLLPNCMIADMDATLCFNVSGRPFFGPGTAEKIPTDKLNIPVLKIFNNYLKCATADDRIFIITGREAVDDVKAATELYIKENISTDPRVILLMREKGDHSSGDIAKKSLYEKYIKNQYNVDFVIDDSNKIVEMYRSLGLTVLQPNEGKF